MDLLFAEGSLLSGAYRHGGYRTFTVFENKKRSIVVASIRDRVVHRLMYDYLVPIFDKTFLYDVWSCRKGKGLCAAIERAQFFMRKYRHGFVWRADVRKFFDHVDHDILLRLLGRRITDAHALVVLKKIIGSYKSAAFTRERERE